MRSGWSRPSSSHRVRGLALATLLAAAVVAWGVQLVRWRAAAPVRSHVEAGIEFANRRMGAQAEREWREALRLDPRCAAAWELLGDYYLSWENGPGALEAFRQLERVAPATPALHERLAASARLAGDQLAALRYAERELERNPRSATALDVAAEVLSLLSDERRELELLRRLAALKPADRACLARLARALVRAGAYEEARAVADRIIALDESDPEAWGLRGRAWFSQDPSPQGLRRAESDLLRSAALGPEGPTQRLFLGRVYQHMGRPEKALRWLQEAARMAPRDPDVHFELARVCASLGRKADAERAQRRFSVLRRQADLAIALEKRCAIRPDGFEEHLQAGLVNMERGDRARADYYLHRAALLRPGDARARAALHRLARLD